MTEHNNDLFSSMLQYVETIIIGSGFGGISAAVNLLEKDKNDFVILERRSFVGGTWMQNSYPGAAVDVPSPLYSLSFAPWDWTRMYAKQAELETYTKNVYQKYQLTNKTQVSATVTGLKWCPLHSAWQVEVNNRPAYTCKFVINASGPLSTPVIPHFKGIECFKGVSFHTNQWPAEFDYSNKRMAIIGSGASAVQVIPEIAKTVNSLDVFQRTPHWILPRPERIFRSWQRALLRTRLGYKLIRSLIYWSLEFRIIGFKYSGKLLNFLAGRPAQKHLKQQIKSEQLRARLTPDYTIGCKRILLSNTFYPALLKDHVHFHDKTDAISHFTESGLVTVQGKHIELDGVIFATGFDATDGIIDYPVEGKNHQTLAEVWQDYPRAYLGTSVPEFPNFFIVTGPNTGIGHTSAIFMIESQMHYIMQAIEYVDSQHASQISVRPEAEQKYTSMIHTQMEQTVWQQGGCFSWYKSVSGKVIAMFPGFSFTFRRLCRKFKPADHIIE